MNNEKYNQKAVSSLLMMYEKIETDLLITIANHFKYEEEFQNSDYWRLKKLDEMGLFNEEVIEYLAKYTKKTKQEIIKALNSIGYNTLNYKSLEKSFQSGKLKINPKTLLNNNVIQTIINTAYDEEVNHFIKMSSKIAESARNAYLDIVEDGYLKTSMGTHSYQEAIRENINALGNKGITTLIYTTTDENGEIIGVRNYDIESTARREILTGARQLSNNINKKVVEELECEYVYLSEHIKCRPQHFPWQGLVIKYKDLEEITGYGKIDGLCGINCGHYFEPYFGTARDKELKTISFDTATKQYELSQQQRYLERGIRKWKRKAEMFKTNGDLEAFSKCKSKVKEWEQRIQSFVNENDLKRDYNREYVYKKTPDWYVNLNTDEKIAINSYISADSYLINDALRNNYPLDNRLKSVSDNLSSALAKIPNSSGTYYRSLFLEDEAKKQFALSIENNKLKLNSFTSMSKDIYDDNDDVRLIIHSKTAKDLSKINIEEQEVLLDKNKEFKILKTWQENGKILYEMEEL